MSDLGDDAVRHLQALLRIDTTNPPGNETPAAQYLAELLSAAGLAPTLIGETPERQNVVARLAGTGEKPPLLLAAHLDVVPAEPESWTRSPFAGEIHEGYLWGRGAIDMKHMAVMAALVLARLKQEGVTPKRDLIFAGVADEEAGCDHGSRWLVDHHPDLVRAEFALGELGGFSVRMSGRVIYPIMVAEKGTVWMKLRATGRPGHGSVPRENNAVARIGAAVAKLAATRLPQHRTQVVDRYLRAIAKTQPFPNSALLPRLHNPRIASFVLRRVPDKGVAAALAAALSNTAVPTVLRAGGKTNVIPGFAEAWVDGRSLPGQTAADLDPRDQGRHRPRHRHRRRARHAARRDRPAVAPVGHHGRGAQEARPRGRAGALSRPRLHRRQELGPPGHALVRLHPAALPRRRHQVRRSLPRPRRARPRRGAEVGRRRPLRRGAHLHLRMRVARAVLSNSGSNFSNVFLGAVNVSTACWSPTGT